VLEPNQFFVNEAWLIFQLNEDPIKTERDGSFNAICLMDAGSCFMLATTMVPAQDDEPSELEVARLFKAAWDHRRQFPVKLFVPAGQFEIVVPTYAESHGVSVVTMQEDELSAFTDEARKGFMEYVGRGHAH
jgi:hypothetical protein